MRQLLAMQRQIQDLQKQIENAKRVGKITHVKFDKEKKRWYAKFQEGDGKEAFKTDWLPWKTFAHGAIKISLPPKVGMTAQMVSLNGMPELGHIEAYHNDPENQSPHDKEDEFFMRVELPGKDGQAGGDKNQILNFHFTKDGSKVEIGDTTYNLTKDAASTKTKTNSVDADTDTSKSKTHKVETESRQVQAKVTQIKSDSYSLGGKVLINC